MTFWFLVLLGLAWIGVFLPAAIRARQAAPSTTADRFRKGLDLIAPSGGASTGRWVVLPTSSEHNRSRAFRRSQIRRRRLLGALMSGTLLSLPAAAFVGGAMWNVLIALFGSLIFYVVLLLGTKRQRSEQAAKVKDLSERRPASDERVVFHEPVSATGGSST